MQCDAVIGGWAGVLELCLDEWKKRAPVGGTTQADLAMMKGSIMGPRALLEKYGQGAMKSIILERYFQLGSRKTSD